MIIVSNPMLDDFLAKYIVPKGHTPADIKARMLHFVEAINESNQSNGPKLAHRRKMAKQSLRRLIRRYPHLASQLVYDKFGMVAA
jgi:hypothetical protein